MTKEQVGYFIYQHTDHHLRQFNSLRPIDIQQKQPEINSVSIIEIHDLEILSLGQGHYSRHKITKLNLCLRQHLYSSIHQLLPQENQPAAFNLQEFNSNSQEKNG